MAEQEPEMIIRGDPESFGEGRTNALLPNTRSSCFCFPCFGSRRSSSTVGLVWWERIRTVQSDHWWARGVRAFKKLREWSEIVAGPRWKTFIRRLNRTKSSGGSGSGSGNRHGKFQYDPLSYSLNFDQGPGHNGNLEEEEYIGFHDFSTRYAPVSGSGSIPVQVKSGVALESGKDVAVFG